MFGRTKTHLVVEKVEESVPPPVKALGASGLDSESRKNYLQLALKNGISTSSVLKLLLEEHAFEVFPFEKVSDYLDKIYGGHPDEKYYEEHEIGKQQWGWRGLRFSDQRETSRAYNSPDRKILLRGPYEKDVPFAVLQTVDKLTEILKESKLEVQFYVSDRYTVEDRRLEDPFLGVSLRGARELFIIERWDEPGYRV